MKEYYAKHLQRNIRSGTLHLNSTHVALADLPVAVYITTNFDDSLTQALVHRGKEPVREIYRWNSRIQQTDPSRLETDRFFIPSISRPIVFHLYGHLEDPGSLVLSEDDHLDFIWSLSTRSELLPQQIREALFGTALLFAGYSLREWEFRALLRGILATAPATRHAPIFAQQYVPWTHTEEQRKYLQDYLDKYLRDMGVHVFWGDTSTFLLELNTRLKRMTVKDRTNLQDAAQASESVDERAIQQHYARIFLSYVREDRQRVQSLYQRLQDAGFDPWMDSEQILPGERWRLAIDKAIHNSSFFLACLSNASVSKRGFIQRELKEALDLWKEMHDDDIYLIPVRFEDCGIPDALREFQCVDLFDDTGLERLIQAISVGVQRRG